MPNSYTQLHIQFVFAVKYRRALIRNEWIERLHQYITGIFQTNKHKMLQINSMPDQDCYGAFSYAKSQVNDVVRYIQNPEIHHRKETFLDEYRKFLIAFEIEWEEKYIFTELQ